MVKYRPSDKNEKPDAISRRWDLRPKEGSEDLQPVQLLFKPSQLQISAARVIQLCEPFEYTLQAPTKRDKAWLATRDAVAAKKE